MARDELVANTKELIRLLNGNIKVLAEFGVETFIDTEVCLVLSGTSVIWVDATFKVKL